MMQRNGFVHFKNCSELEAMFVEPLLESAGIPFYRVEPGTGAYLRLYMGAAPFQIEIYVPAERLAEAAELLALQEADDAEEEEHDEHDERAKRPFATYARRIIATCLLALFVVESVPAAVHIVENIRDFFMDDAQEGLDPEEDEVWLQPVEAETLEPERQIDHLTNIPADLFD